MWRFVIPLFCIAAVTYGCRETSQKPLQKFCDNKQKLLVPSPFDTIQWDLSLSMTELYKSAHNQLGLDSCVGGRVYISKIFLNGEYFAIPVLIGNQACECCPINPPVIMRAQIAIEVWNKGLTIYGDTVGDQLNFKDFLLKETLKRFHPNDRSVNFLLRWNESVAPERLQQVVLSLTEVYLDYLAENFQWVDEHFCESDVPIEEKSFPIIFILVEAPYTRTLPLVEESF